MLERFSKIITNFTFLDQYWGGIFRGGNYLIIGPRKTGKTLLSLRMLENFSKAQKCLFVTDQRRKSVFIQAVSIDFDLDGEEKSKNIIFESFSHLNTASKEFKAKPEIMLKEIFNSLKNLIIEEKPSLLIIDELSQLINKSETSIFNQFYMEFLELLDEKDITSFFVLGKPISENSKKSYKIAARNSVGIIYLKPDSDSEEQNNYSGTVILKPNIGHIEGEFSVKYYLVPHMGFVTESENVQNKATKAALKMEVPSTEIKLDNFVYSNLYDWNDFALLLNSKISEVGSLGTNVNLISLELKALEVDESIISVKNIRDYIANSLLLKDKITLKGNKVYLLVDRKNQSEVNELLKSIKGILSKRNIGERNLNEIVLINNELLTPDFSIVDKLLDNSTDGLSIN